MGKRDNTLASVVALRDLNNHLDMSNTAKTIKSKYCECCGAPLSNLYKCDYCGSRLYTCTSI